MELDLLCELGEDINEQGLPPGFRFHPTDEELITFYLSSKVFFNSSTSTSNVSSTTLPTITEVDLNRCEPWDLPEAARTGEREWYLFSLRDRKYPTGLRTNRATGAGYWKATGKDKEVYASNNNNNRLMIGMKKTLVFYKGRAPRGDKTRWVMHEFRLDGHLLSSRHHHLPFTEEWVICRVYHKLGDKTNKNPLLLPPQTNYHLLDMMLSSNSSSSSTQTASSKINQFPPPLIMDAITSSSSAYHHHHHHNQYPQEEETFHLNKLIRSLNPSLPDSFNTFLMNNTNNNNDIQLPPPPPTTSSCSGNNDNRIVDRQTNNCMSHQQDLLHQPTINTTVPKQFKTETNCFTSPGQLMMIHPSGVNDPYYGQLFGNDFGFMSNISPDDYAHDVALRKNWPHLI